MAEGVTLEEHGYAQSGAWARLVISGVEQFEVLPDGTIELWLNTPTLEALKVELGPHECPHCCAQIRMDI